MTTFEHTLFDSFMKEMPESTTSPPLDGISLYSPLEPLLFGDYSPPLEPMSGTPGLDTGTTASSSTTDELMRSLCMSPMLASPASEVQDVPLFGVPSMEDGPLSTISPEMMTLDSMAGPAPRRRGRKAAQKASEVMGTMTPTSSDGSSFSPEFDFADDKPAPRKARNPKASGSRAPAPPTATSRRDETDTYHRYVSAQIRKGRDIESVAAEGRVKAEEKRHKNRDYARSKLATGKAKTAELEGQVYSLKAGNDELAGEVRQLEEELAALGGSLEEQKE